MTITQDPISVTTERLPDGRVTFAVTLDSNKFSPNLLECENTFMDAQNALGRSLYSEVLTKFDVDEPQLVLPVSVVYYNCGTFPQTYETPSGPVTVERHMYQNSRGGKKLCPLEERGGMVLNSTPKYAQIVTSKAANLATPAVQKDLRDNHNRDISVRYVKTMLDTVGEIARYAEKNWQYDIPEHIAEEDVATLSLGIDGTCMYLLNGGGWREAMVGTISLYDKEGNRLHTIRLGAAPEYGKEDFYSLMDREWDIVRQKFPTAATQGLADGAPSNWKWLNERTEIQLLDFWHLSEYITKAASALFGASKKNKVDDFTSYWCSYVKHHCYGVNKLIKELEESISSKKKVKDPDSLRTVIEYLKHQANRTHYSREIEANRPIGSGVTEATCKTLIKSRMCQSGMRWKFEGASNVISIRALVISDLRWDQFWDTLMNIGVSNVMRMINFKK